MLSSFILDQDDIIWNQFLRSTFKWNSIRYILCSYLDPSFHALPIWLSLHMGVFLLWLRKHEIFLLLYQWEGLLYFFSLVLLAMTSGTFLLPCICWWILCQMIRWNPLQNSGAISVGLFPYHQPWLLIPFRAQNSATVCSQISGICAYPSTEI